MEHVKSKRRYDSGGRLEEARRRRATVLQVADRQFGAHGYAGATIAGIAAEARVSVETVYKYFGGKAGLVRAIYEQGLAGTGLVPAYQRSDDMREREPDPQTIMREWGLLTAEVAALVTPIRLLMRSAAANDVEIAAHLENIDNERLKRMRHHARYLKEAGHLREGVTVRQATDILWLCSSAELYDLLVLKRGWSSDEFAEHVTQIMTSTML